MRPMVAALPLLLAMACAPIQTVALSKERIPAGSQITVHVLGFDGTGMEHVISETLMNAGFDVRSSAAIRIVATRTAETDSGESTDLLRRYQTPYVCRVKAAGRGRFIEFFTLQLVHVESGKIILSMRGGDGTNSYTAEEVAKTLRERLPL